jgi:hypothetical protein
LLVVAALLAAAVVGWQVHAATYGDSAFEQMTRCLTYEKHAATEATGDPIARSAELGALQTVIETNAVTISVAGSGEGAERIVSAYRAVGGELGTRLEQRGRTVYLWERPPSPTQRQALFDCTY